MTEAAIKRKGDWCHFEGRLVTGNRRFLPLVEMTEAALEMTEAALEMTEAAIEMKEAAIEMTEAAAERTETVIERKGDWCHFEGRSVTGIPF